MDLVKNEGLKRIVATMVPSVVGYQPGLPEIPPEQVAEFTVSYVGREMIELIYLLRVTVIVLNVMTLVTRGKLFKNLEREQQDQLLINCVRSRFRLIRYLAMLIKLPIELAYYDNDEVLVALGFDREALCADADLHQVTR